MSMKFGVIGVGTAGAWYADILKKTADVELAAALRSRGGDTAAIEKSWGVPCFDNLETFLGTGLNAAIIATPSGQHFQQAQALIREGVHVLVEKPICLEVEAAETLVAAAKRHDVRLGVTFQRRADPCYRAIKETITSGAFGEPTLLSITMPYFRTPAYYDSAPWRGTYALDGGGVLMNQGVHLADLAVWLFGTVKRVSAFAATRSHDIEVEDTLSAALEFHSGALGTISGTTASPPGVSHSVDICGTLGSLRLAGDTLVRWDVPGVPQPEGGVSDGAASDPKATSTENHARIVEDFAAAVRHRRDPLVTGEDALESLGLVKAIYRAASEGHVIEL